MALQRQPSDLIVKRNVVVILYSHARAFPTCTQTVCIFFLTRSLHTNDAPTMHQPCTNHAPTMHRPCTNDTPTMHQRYTSDAATHRHEDTRGRCMARVSHDEILARSMRSAKQFERVTVCDVIRLSRLTTQLLGMARIAVEIVEAERTAASLIP